MIEERLKPCPFCGNPADLFGDKYEGFAVVCEYCDAALGWGENCFPEGHFFAHAFLTAEDAIEAWNTRI